jgi:hypothetical protein
MKSNVFRSLDYQAQGRADFGADGQRRKLAKSTPQVAQAGFAKRVMMARAAKSLHPDSTIRRITGYTYRLPVPVGEI